MIILTSNIQRGEMVLHFGDNINPLILQQILDNPFMSKLTSDKKRRRQLIHLQIHIHPFILQKHPKDLITIAGTSQVKRSATVRVPRVDVEVGTG